MRDGNEETIHYFHDEKALREFHEENPDLNLFDAELGQELLPLGDSAKTNGTSRRRGKKVELHESAAIQKLIAELARKGLKVDHYAASDRPIFELIEGEGDKAVSHPLFSIPEILHKILEIGRRGVQIKRFKGLGEMNAKELFETTMNPEKRKLLKVDLNDERCRSGANVHPTDGGRGRAAPAVHRRQRAQRAKPGCIENDEARITNVEGNGAVTLFLVSSFVTIRHSSFLPCV